MRPHTDADQLRAIADRLPNDDENYGGSMQQDLRRIADNLDEWEGR